jgi:ABC-2 type transport system ATP-binding protein
MSDTTIETLGLTKRYGPTAAVDGLSFQVRPGQVTGFLGPNGAGKSTTLRMILGMDTPTAGRALIGGCAYRDLDEPLRAVGSLLDPGALHPGRRARDHLVWLAASNRLPARRVGEVLEQTGLAAVAGKRVGSFSLGMKQRLGIAAALLGEPGILLLDEPVNGLDPEGVLWIRTLMRTLASEGRTILVSSHLMSEMALTADHLIVIGRGRLIADMSMHDLIQTHAPGDVLVRTPEGSLLADVLRAQGAAVRPEADGALAVTGLAPQTISRAAAARGIAVHELATRQASLEQAYMRLTEAAVEYRANPAPQDTATISGRLSR